jgi:DHA2 family multidrug resistance protein
MNAPLNRRMITLSIMLATIMQTLDSTIANVALPHMQGSLSASQDQIAGCSRPTSSPPPSPLR